MKQSHMLLLGLSLALTALGMDREYTMPGKKIIFAQLTNGSTCFDEHDQEATNLATVLAHKTLALPEIESRVNGAVTRYANYLEQVLEDMQPSTALKRCVPSWKKKVLEAVLAAQKVSDKK